MALFGEKYGDVVRMVEVGDGSVLARAVRRHARRARPPRSASSRSSRETSSAANVRRIEALTGPAAVALLRAHDRALRDDRAALRTPPEQVAGGGRGCASSA